MSAILKHADRIAVHGDYLIHRVDFSPLLVPALDHLRRLDLRQPAPISDADRAMILRWFVPCYEMEHRHGVCPLGLDHSVEDSEGHNTIVTSLKQSIIDQATGQDSSLDLTITYIATGTSSVATTSDMTQLDAEYYRDVPTYLSKVSATQGQAFWYFGPGVANAGSDLQEWGIMAGGATSSSGSGTMIARFLQTFTKNSGTAVNGQYTLNVA